MTKNYSPELKELPSRKNISFKKNPWEYGFLKDKKLENKKERINHYGKNYKKYLNAPKRELGVFNSFKDLSGLKI